MTDERKEFEAVVKATWGDTYSFAQDEDAHYCEFALDAMWWGWQARGEGTPEPRVTLDLEAPPASLRSGDRSARVVGKLKTDSDFCYAVAVKNRNGDEGVVWANRSGVLQSTRDNLTVAPIHKEDWVNVFPLADEGQGDLACGGAEKQAVSVPQQWREIMEELAADLENEIEARRSSGLDRRIERDLVIVREARALLAEQEKNVGPYIKRKQAEALESVCRSYARYGLSNSYTAFEVSQNLEAEANRLRGEAAKAEQEQDHD